MPKVLDEVQLAELCELMGDDLVPLVQAFLRDGQERLQLLERDLLAGEYELARRQAHSLKGSSSNLGATALSAACLQLETLARDASATGVGAPQLLLALVRLEFETVSLELQQRFLRTANDLLC
jgi:histidine phosphotransfer protein HptB